MTAYQAMKSGKIGVEESREVIHKIGITLSFKNVKNLEEACADLVCGEKDKNLKVKCPVRIPTKILPIAIQNPFMEKEPTHGIGRAMHPQAKRVMDLFSSLEVIKQITSITVE
uniref:Uncharacterized protein n=1 Tax=Kalanchoe fedtschenkoi TaxID=63787 RepID=A0A7N0VJC9_KALFE